LPAIYDRVNILNENLIATRNGEIYELHKYDGKSFKTLMNKYDNVIDSNGDFHLVELRGKKFLIDNKGREYKEDDNELPF
jgi:hypothetical protein